jgi:DNA polymerase
MTELHREFLDIVTQVRTHLEYQMALGVRAVEVGPSSGENTAAPSPVRIAPDAAEKSATCEPRVTPSTGLEGVRRDLETCTSCVLHDNRTSIVFGEGNPRAALVFIGESPVQTEGGEGQPFGGAAGQLLNDIIVKGMKLRSAEVYLCTIVKCLPRSGKDPGQHELEACEQFLVKQLQAIKPRVIVALGDAVAKALLKTGEDMSALRGKWHTYHGIPLMPTFHPAHLILHPQDKKAVWEDIQKVMGKLKEGDRRQKTEDRSQEPEDRRQETGE